MGEEQLNILIVEDETAHAEAISRAFSASNPLVMIRIAGTLHECRQEVAANLPDIVLIDMNLPDGQATELMNCPAVERSFPLLIMTAYGNEQMAVSAMKAGALDYIVKSPETFAGMPQTVERALREWKLLQKHQQTERSLRESESRFRRLLQEIPSVAFQGYGMDGTVNYWNLASERLYGYTAIEAIGRNLLDLIIPPGMREEMKDAFKWMTETGQAVRLRN